MNGERVARIWGQVAAQARGAAVSVVHVCAAAVDGVRVDGAGASVMTGPTVRETVTATDALAVELGDLQLTLGQGPGVDSFTEGGPVLAADLRSPEYLARWPVFTAAALDRGAGAVFAFPLQVGAIRLGVLDLYRALPGGLGPPELADALAFADAVSMLLLDAAAGTLADTAELAWQYDDPSRHHAVVHQATGMILVQLRCGAEEAFARLRAHAYVHDRRLGDVARDVVERRLRFDPDPRTPGR